MMLGMTTRRSFIGGIAAVGAQMGGPSAVSAMAAPAGGSPVAATDEKPLLKIGVMTDTHIGDTKESCSRVRLAYELFRDIGVDLIVNGGDVADRHSPAGYVAYREMVEETFAGVKTDHRPQELFVYATHDAFHYRSHPREDARKDAPEAFAEMQRLIKSPNGPYAEGEIKGYPYVVIPQFSGREGKVDWARFDAMLAAAVKFHPEKPVFVFAHVPPEGTTRHGSGSAEKRAILDRYPQAVNISGHVHGSLRDERAIWQGAFTSVSAGCLQNWGGVLTGAAATRMQNYGALLIEVYAERIVFRRFDVRDRREYAADAPWAIPWPFDPATAPYHAEIRCASAAVPQFAPGAKVEMKPDGDPFKSLTFAFPCVGGSMRPFTYRIELSKRGAISGWTPFARRDMFGDFWQRESERARVVSQTFGASYFEEGREYRVAVAPRNSWGREGKSIETVFTAGKPVRDGALVWESSNPMKECQFLKGLAGKEAYVAKDGFYALERNAQARLVLPKDAWKAPKETRFRFTVDMHTIQGETPCWDIVLRNRKPVSNAVQRIGTPPGDSGIQRYVIEFTKPDATYSYSLLVRYGGKGRIRFAYARIERLKS